jgi:hypothetical protein
MQDSPHRVITGFPSMIAAQTPEELFKQVICAFGMNGHFHEWSAYLDGIRE